MARKPQWLYAPVCTFALLTPHVFISALDVLVLNHYPFLTDCGSCLGLPGQEGSSVRARWAAGRGAHRIRPQARFWLGAKPAGVNGNLPVDVMGFGAGLGLDVLQASVSNVNIWRSVNNR